MDAGPQTLPFQIAHICFFERPQAYFLSGHHHLLIENHMPLSFTAGITKQIIALLTSLRRRTHLPSYPDTTACANSNPPPPAHSSLDPTQIIPPLQLPPSVTTHFWHFSHPPSCSDSPMPQEQLQPPVYCTNVKTSYFEAWYHGSSSSTRPPRTPGGGSD